MKIFKGLKAVRGLKGTVVTIGVFYGVHIGNRAIIRKTVSQIGRASCRERV